MKTEYKLKDYDGLCIVEDGDNHYLIDTSCPVSLTEVDTIGGFAFGDDWLPLGKEYSIYSIENVNSLLKQQYEIPFRIHAVIGNDILKRYVTTIDYTSNSMTFERIAEKLAGQYKSPEEYYGSLKI